MKLREFASYLYKFRWQLCLPCLLLLYLLIADVIPRTVWAFDRSEPYEFTDVLISPGYPGQLVSISATVIEKKPGRVCGVVVNPQTIGEDGRLAFVNQTRLIAGEAMQTMERDAKGHILFKTNLQVPPTIKPGMAHLIVPLEFICKDNGAHASKPVHGVIKTHWLVTERPDNAPSCGSMAAKPKG